MKIFKNFLRLEKKDQVIFFLLVTALGNALVGVVKFILGLVLPSLWFWLNAGFSIVLALSRIFSVRDYRNIRLGKKEKSKIGYQNYLNNGILLILLGISYFCVSVYIYYKGMNTNMHEYLTYLVALIAFWSIGSAIYGMIKYKKNHDPILAAVKITNFASALTSIVLTQVVLLDTFSNEIDTRIADSCMGMGVSIIIIGLGIYMIVSIKKYITLEDKKEKRH